MSEYDQIDRNIVAAMQTNADISNSALAEKVGLSPSACLRRVANLKASGVIQSIVAVVDPKFYNRKLSAIITIKLERHGPTFRQNIIKSIENEPAVSQCHLVSGASSCVRPHRKVCT